MRHKNIFMQSTPAIFYFSQKRFCWILINFVDVICKWEKDQARTERKTESW